MIMVIFYVIYYFFFQSKTITDAVYFGDWWKYDQATKKSLTLMMEAAKRPLVVNVFIFDLSLATLTTVSNFCILGDQIRCYCFVTDYAQNVFTSACVGKPEGLT